MTLKERKPNELGDYFYAEPVGSVEELKAIENPQPFEIRMVEDVIKKAHFDPEDGWAWIESPKWISQGTETMNYRGTKILKFLYTNYRGETRNRSVLPRSLWFGSTEWYSEPQWFLKALDVDKDSERDFALKKITAWT